MPHRYPRSPGDEPVEAAGDLRLPNICQIRVSPLIRFQRTHWDLCQYKQGEDFGGVITGVDSG